MRFVSLVSSSLKALFLLGFVSIFNISHAQSNVNVRVMAANLNGDAQTYQPSALRIFQGLKPDVVAIQEFKYGGNTVADIRSMVDTAFGTNYVYYREPYTANGDLPNGIISRYPIVNSNSWVDPSVANRGFAWAQIQLPGTNFLYVVSVHLLTSSSGNRATEAANLKTLIQTNFPANAWIVLAGDFNTGSRTETCMTTFKTFLSDAPVPVDNNGDSDTNGKRNAPHDYVLPSFALTNLETATVLPSHTFPSGLVFDSTVYTPLSDVPPVQFEDSTNGNAQHMAVMKDFLIPVAGGNSNAPTLATQPQGQVVSPGGNVTFSVTANGTPPLSYQWLFNGTNIFGATTNPFTLANVQLTNTGNYSVVVTNFIGSVTSSSALLIVSNSPPVITAQPAAQSVFAGQFVMFNVSATGADPLNYQWQFNGTNISGATTNLYSLASAQLADAGNYSVIVSNFVGSVTSSIVALTVNPPVIGTPVVLAGWDVNGLGSYGPSPFAPTTSAPNLTINGLTRGSGVTTINTASTNSWGGNSFNTASESAAITANDFVTFSISAKAGYTVSFTALNPFDYKRSSAGPTNGVLQFQVGAGAFTDAATFAYPATSTTSLPAVDLSGIAALQNVSSNIVVTFRLVNYGATSSGGNWYIADGETGAPDFVIQGIINSAAPPTNAPAIISGTTITGGQLQFSVTGTAGGNYIVQTSTNLTGGNWISVLTNQSPFSFTDTNFTNAQKFYRVVAP